MRFLMLSALAKSCFFSQIASAIEFSGDPAVKGQEIAAESDRRGLGFGDSQAVMKMLLRNAHGDTSTRELRMSVLENEDPNDGDFSLIVFDKPLDIEGTALLTHAHILDPDDQWMYIPALKRVKRIASANKSGPFMGSEFAYEDLSSTEVAKYSYAWLRDEACPGEVSDRKCFVTERRPLYEKSGYTRQIVWPAIDALQPRKIDYYDRKDALLKTLNFTGYTLYLERIWRAHSLEMVNHQTHKSSVLVWEDFQFQTGLTKRDFDKNSLKRAR